MFFVWVRLPDFLFLETREVTDQYPQMYNAGFFIACGPLFFSYQAEILTVGVGFLRSKILLTLVVSQYSTQAKGMMVWTIVVKCCAVRSPVQNLAPAVLLITTQKKLDLQRIREQYRSCQDRMALLPRCDSPFAGASATRSPPSLESVHRHSGHHRDPDVLHHR